ncbi:MAG: ABC transporter permease [Acidobacteriota bacterium]
MARVHIGESISMSVGSLWANKLRTFLTLLGIIIGVLTIIAVVSIIQGLNNYVYERMTFYGANDFSVSKFSFMGTSLQDYREQLKRKNLTLDDMRLIRERCEYCELVGASRSASRTVKFRNQSLRDVSVRGATHIDHLIGSVEELEYGHQILKEMEDHSRRVCVIGADVADRLFPHLNPIGRWIRIGNHHFRVIGVAKAKGKILGMSQDNFARIPITSFQKLYGSRETININIHTLSQEHMDLAQEEVRTILRTKRHIPFGEPDDFSFQTSDQFIQIYKSATTGIYFAMIAISSLALIVGGIVVMNIMLVSVTERINEIGIRMAVGARRADILFQFLIEAATLSTIGGAVGIILGFVLAKVISSATSLPSSVDPVSIVIAVAVSASVGIFFGIYPANKASSLDPIEALRTGL